MRAICGPTTLIQIARKPGGTDSTSFSWIGLNGIGLMQDALEYGTRTQTWSTSR